MFFSSRVVPHTPPSLVKSSSSARGVMIGADSSVPSSDHVPELRNAVASPAGTAVKAEPVSWHAGVTIGTPASDGSASLRSGPSTVPGSTISGSSRVGNVQFLEQFPGPRSLHGVNALRRRRVRVFGLQRAGQPEIQDIGNRREPVRGGDRLRRVPARGVELIQRVEPQELNPRRGVDPIA